MIFPEFVRTNVDLATRNTLALPGRAAWLAEITAPEQLTRLADFAAPRRCVLGGGSNLVLRGDFDGLLLQMDIRGRALVAEDNSAWYVQAGAGENWADFVAWTLSQGWPGLENLSLIPGTVGAAPVQNIGAYGLELADRFHSLSAIDMTTGRSVALDQAACRFAYRDSVFKQEGWHLNARCVITAVTFRLPKDWQPLTRYAGLADELAARYQHAPTPGEVAEAVMAIRRRKLPDPSLLPNAGSFFHNPCIESGLAARLKAAHPALPTYPQDDGRVKLAAAWLIEQAGWKGKRLGPVGMYDRQALVLVNHGGAHGADVLALMQAVQNAVHTRFGIDLTPEPVFI